MESRWIFIARSQVMRFDTMHNQDHKKGYHCNLHYGPGAGYKYVCICILDYFSFLGLARRGKYLLDKYLAHGKCK